MPKRAIPSRAAVWAIYRGGAVLVDLRGLRCVPGDRCLVPPRVMLSHPERYARASGPGVVETRRAIWVVEDDEVAKPAAEPEQPRDDGSPDEHACTECGSTYRTARGLANHLRIKHGGH